MTHFEFVFSLFGLLLGLSLAEILGGFAKALKRHGRHRTGVLTPLLSIFLLYDITTFWITAWRVRDAYPIHIAALVVGLIITGLYYFAAVLVWPEQDDTVAWNDLDGWMLAHKRQVMLSVFTCNALGLSGAGLLAPQSFHWSTVQMVLLTLYFVFLLLTGCARTKRATLWSLGALVALYGLDLVTNVTGG